MNRYLADLHIHTCLSPCGSLDMSPAVVVRTALDRGLSAIAITDHNSTLQCAEIQAVGADAGLLVFAGSEVTSREEVHCVCLFANEASRLAFQSYLEKYLPRIPNNAILFGDQVWVDCNEEIVGEVPYMLISAINQGVDQIADYVHTLGGLFIPAHVERSSFSIISQLGFINPSLPLDGIEFNHPERFAKLLTQHAYLKKYTCYTASDAHTPEQIGATPALWQTSELSFEHLRMAFAGQDDHFIYPFDEKNL